MRYTGKQRIKLTLLCPNIELRQQLEIAWVLPENQYETGGYRLAGRENLWGVENRTSGLPSDT